MKARFVMRPALLLGVAVGLSIPVPCAAQTSVDVFDPFAVLTFQLQIEDADWNTIRRDTTNEIEVPALFWAEGGEEGPLLVSVRRKSSRPLPSELDPIKVGLKVDINEFVGGQRWRGLTKLSLENGGDTNPVAEGLAWNLHEMATGPGLYPSGYHPGLAAWVRLFVNGQYIGLYLNAEERDSQFLRNRGLPRGTTAEGVTRSWLYEIDDRGPGQFELEDGDLPHGPTWTTLCYAPFTVGSKKKPACRTPNDATLAAALPSLIDMPIMLTQGAVDGFSANGDALFSHGKNFRHVDFNTELFPDRKRLYLTWDLDGAIVDVNANVYQIRSTPTEYESIILRHPVFRSEFNAILTGLLDPAGPLSEAALHTFLDVVEAAVSPALVADPYAGFATPAAAAALFDGLRGWISQRIVNVQAQLAANQPPPRQP
jgi:hypothetical protein